jgi:hypothetical protein
MMRGSLFRVNCQNTANSPEVIVDLILDIVTFISALFIVLLGLGFLTIVSFYVIDRLQT